MKISKETAEVFKNMAQINSGLVVDEPKHLKTMSPTGSIIAIYDPEEEFPLFSIWDFAKFNSLIDVFGVENSEFKFVEESSDDMGYVEVSSGSRKIKYEYAEMGTQPIFEQIKDAKAYKAFDKFGFTFKLSSDDIKEIKKVNSIFGFSEDILKIDMKDGVGKITIFSEKAEIKSDFTIEIDGEGTGEAMTKVEDLIMINTDYEAHCSEQMIKYQAVDKPLMYFIRTVLKER